MPNVGQTIVYNSGIVPTTATGVSYLWSLPNGGGTAGPNMTSPSLSVTWTSIGDFPISLTITNNCSEKTTSTTINVTAGGGRIPAPTYTYPVDVVASYWLQDTNDWVNCDSINPNYPNCVLPGYAGVSNGAKARISNYNLRSLTKPPFYAEYQPVHSINDNIGNSGNTDYNVNFNQIAFDKVLEYTYGAGIKALEFYFYDSDADVAEHIGYNQTTSSEYAADVKYFYAFGSFGYNASTTIDRIVSHMSQSRYYKIGNRPVITLDNPEENKFHVDRWIESYGATYHDTGQEQYYTENPGYSGQIIVADRNGPAPAIGFVPASGLTSSKIMIDNIRARYAALNSGVDPYLIVQGAYYYHDGSGGYSHEAVSAYSLPPVNNWSSNHSYSNLINFNINALSNIINNTTKKVIPCITLGFINGDINGQLANYSDSATPAQLIDHTNQVKAFVQANLANVPFIKYYSLGETIECGSGALVPRKNLNGTIDKSMLNAVATAVSN